MIQCELELHFNPQFAYARKLFRSGALGKLKSVYLTNISQSPCNYFPNWGDPVLSYGRRVPLRPGSETCRGGAITDHPHPFDLIRWITGREFRTVSCGFGPEPARPPRGRGSRRHHRRTGRWREVFHQSLLLQSGGEGADPAVLWPKSLECNLKLTGTKGYFSCDFFDRHIYIIGNRYVSPGPADRGRYAAAAGRPGRIR